MVKNKNQKRKVALAMKNSIEALRFQTLWGLKKLGFIDEFHEENQDDNNILRQAVAEITEINELGLTLDLLSLKRMIDGIKQYLLLEPVEGKGDLQTSIVAFALGITKQEVVTENNVWSSWNLLKNKKILSLYYPSQQRNRVVDWVRNNGYNTSTYLGQPIVRLEHLYIMIKNAR